MRDLFASLIRINDVLLRRGWMAASVGPSIGIAGVVALSGETVLRMPVQLVYVAAHPAAVDRDRLQVVPGLVAVGVVVSFVSSFRNF